MKIKNEIRFYCNVSFFLAFRYSQKSFQSFRSSSKIHKILPITPSYDGVSSSLKNTQIDQLKLIFSIESNRLVTFHFKTNIIMQMYVWKYTKPISLYILYMFLNIDENWIWCKTYFILRIKKSTKIYKLQSFNNTNNCSQICMKRSRF